MSTYYPPHQAKPQHLKRHFNQAVFWIDRKIIRNIWIETGSSLLVLITSYFAFFRPHEFAEVHHASQLFEATTKLLFLWIAFARLVRFFAALRRHRKKRTTRTFIAAQKRYRHALRTKTSSYAHGIASYMQGHYTYTFFKAKPQDLRILVDLAQRAWDTDKNNMKIRTEAWRTAYFGRLLQSNQNIFSLIRENDVVIGYVSVIPMKSGAHFAGLKCQYQFDLEEKDISEGPSQLVYLQAVYVEDQFENRPGSYQALVNCLIHDIALVASDPRHTILYAEQFTEDGEGLLGKMGFQKLYRTSGSAHPKPFWQLSLNPDDIPDDCEFRNNALLTIRAINDWKEIIAGEKQMVTA